jgi:hypothetical protein
MAGSRRAPILALVTILCSAGAFAQAPGANAPSAPGATGVQGAAGTASAAMALPMGFRNVSLGMGLDQVKAALKADPLFRYRGDPDVSFLPQTSQYLIECEGSTYLRRAYFQFADSRLFIMILVLDAQKLDHYSLFSTLTAKYGQPTSLSPEESVWQSDPVRFSLERPLTVKYIDNKTFAAILAKGGAQKDLDQLSREKFLEQF